MDYYFGVAKEIGVTREEMGVLESIVMAVSAGRVNAQFREARARSRPQETADHDHK
ncbi:MAG: hypothetical protein LAN71_09145 [Acidobacteriia bacterium]|nr:hypothetical protein [Terriglobia bacterium]